MLKQSGFDLCSLFNPEDVLLVLIIPAAVDNLYSNHPFSNAKPRCQYPQYTVSAFPRNFRRTYGDLQPLDGYPIPVLGVDNDMNIRVYEMLMKAENTDHVLQQLPLAFLVIPAVCADNRHIYRESLRPQPAVLHQALYRQGVLLICGLRMERTVEGRHAKEHIGCFFAVLFEFSD